MAKATTLEKRLDSIEALLRQREPEHKLSPEGRALIEVARLAATMPRTEINAAELETAGKAFKVQHSDDGGHTEAPDEGPPEPKLKREACQKQKRPVSPEVDLGAGHGTLSWGARATGRLSEERAWATGLGYDAGDAFGRR